MSQARIVDEPITIRLFPSDPKGCTVSEMIKIRKIRHDNNYWLNTELNDIEIEDEHEDFIKPTLKVTRELLAKHVSRDARTKVEKNI